MQQKYTYGFKTTLENSGLHDQTLSYCIVYRTSLPHLVFSRKTWAARLCLLVISKRYNKETKIVSKLSLSASGLPLTQCPTAHLYWTRCFTQPAVQQVTVSKLVSCCTATQGFLYAGTQFAG
jgi:hypothetical protein